MQFKARPQTSRGLLEGRGWLVLGMAGLVVIAILADEVNQRWGGYWLLVLPLFIAWPALLYNNSDRNVRFRLPDPVLQGRAPIVRQALGQLGALARGAPCAGEAVGASWPSDCRDGWGV